MNGEALTAGGVLKILARSTPRTPGDGDLLWATQLANMLDEMLKGYALVQAIDDVEILKALPVGTRLFSSDTKAVLLHVERDQWREWGRAVSVSPERVLEEHANLFTIDVPQP